MTSSLAVEGRTMLGTGGDDARRKMWNVESKMIRSEAFGGQVSTEYCTVCVGARCRMWGGESSCLGLACYSWSHWFTPSSTTSCLNFIFGRA